MALSDITRRGFTKLAGLATMQPSIASAAILGSSDTNELQAPAAPHRQFPKGFLWGTATASYQVEGAANEDGRGVSIWDTFAHTPGKVINDANGDVADDHYHRYKQDVQLMKALGVKGYRFSIAWPRVVPGGTGAPNPKGLDFYKRLVDELLANGIQPYATLYHWDLPQPLQDKGGWESKDTSKAFGDYAGVVSSGLSDRVKNWFTANEFWVFINLGYRFGTHAPGLQLSNARVNQAAHNAVLGHGLAVQAIRAHAKGHVRVGIADSTSIGVPVMETPDHIAAAQHATRESNAQAMTVIQEGKYTDKFLHDAGADVPKYNAEELKTISTPLDFVGLNIYTGYFVAADPSKPEGYTQVDNPKSYPHMASPWLNVCPEALYWGPRHVSKMWGNKPIYITENGCSSSDIPDKNGKVHDTDRVMYLRNYLTQLSRAANEGMPVSGYFLWSLMDNFEWADGYTNRFGLHYVDYATQTRTPKLSANYYREVISRNSVL
jgi:beta-glucosidase